MATLKESIESAVKDEQNNPDLERENQEKEAPEEDPKDKSEEDDNPEVEDKSNSDSKEDDSSSEDTQEIETAVALLRALRDPSQSKDIIHDLALRVGLINNQENLTKKEEKDIKAVLKETLADEYPDLKDKLEAILNKVTEDSDRKIEALKNEIEERDRKVAEREFSVELDTFFKENKISEKEAEAMIKEIHLVPPGPKISLKNYLSKIHTLVKVSKSTELKTVDRINRINANRKDSTVKNLSSDVDDKRISRGSALPSIKEAIHMAIQDQSK